MLALMLPASAAEGDPNSVVLAPHRAVYDLALARSGGAHSLESARGRIVFDFTGDECQGYSLQYRQVTVLESNETGSRSSDLRNITYESGDGKSFRFKTESQTDKGQSQSVDGVAERGEGASVQVGLRQPKRETFQLSGDPIFPTAHMKKLVELARAGQTTLGIKVFDGSEDGRKVYDTLAVIGRRASPGSSDAIDPPLRDGAMAGMARWPVTLSYFAEGQGERTPVYVLSFDLYENGVSGRLKLDYGDFALKGDLSSIELLPSKACQR
jgi:hypothetical protein